MFGLRKRKKLNQLESVKAHLKKGKTITPKEALNRYGSFRLASIIHRLRTKHGMVIFTDKKNGYAVYKLVS